MIDLTNSANTPRTRCGRSKSALSWPTGRCPAALGRAWEDRGLTLAYCPVRNPAKSFTAARRRPRGQREGATMTNDRRMSALPPKADVERHDCHVRFVPKADVGEQPGLG